MLKVNKKEEKILKSKDYDVTLKYDGKKFNSITELIKYKNEKEKDSKKD